MVALRMIGLEIRCAVTGTTRQLEKRSSADFRRPSFRDTSRSLRGNLGGTSGPAVVWSNVSHVLAAMRAWVRCALALPSQKPHGGLPRRSIPSSARGIDVGPQRFTEVVLNAWSVRRGGVERRQPRIPGARKWVAPSAPGQTIFLNTLGVAQYRAGQHAEAITTWSEAWPPGLARAMLTTSSSSP